MELYECINIKGVKPNSNSLIHKIIFVVNGFEHNTRLRPYQRRKT